MTVFSLELDTSCTVHFISFHLKLSQYVMKHSWNYIQFNWKKGAPRSCQRFRVMSLRCNEGRAVLTVEYDSS